MALPGEARDACRFNGLRKGLGERGLTVIQYVSDAPPEPFLMANTARAVADTRMTEKHYAHLAPRYVADTIRAQFPTLGIVGDTAVTSISRRHK
jgi:hypothetical protein